ncbi:hypothetical protein PF005_g22120 [Phytophthora fragariae]|uniref:Ubiquitin-like protease family profile domain-containing protein n=1 Tax=Phytophthora fragariae TaxID=53985 RepID=A0A6A3R8Z2_9STRA|nr:hypothetical protein PF007_g18457 [Phytophthora fragariae]KAE9183376.1 hypothetical protein PF005_g22120 [Phytophthora fragariae]
MGAKTPVKEQWAAVQLWKKHRWTAGEAVRQLGKPKPTLISWKKEYWDMTEPPPDIGERCRVKGGDRKYRTASFELDVLTFYDDCLRENGKISFAEMMAHCTKIPEFAILKNSTQRTRVRRFMNRCDPNQAQADIVRAAVKTSRVAGNTADSSSETAECYSAQQQSQPKSDGEPDVAQDVTMDDDGEQNPQVPAAVHPQETGAAQPTDDITGEMDWDGYRYILLPVVLHDHWSLLVIERVLQWFFSAVNSRMQASMETQAFSYVSKPRQANSVDCGVCMLHYLYKIKSYVDKHEPRSLSEIMTMLTVGSFNAASSSKARASLLKHLLTTA